MNHLFGVWTLVLAGSLLLIGGITFMGLYTNQYFEDSTDWDLLIFTQSWPNTICLEWKETDPSHTCAFPKKRNDWTIHGVWPTKLGTKGPNYCSKTPAFNATVLESLESDLDEYWTDIETGGGHTKTDLWKHEWLKHGTCATELASLNTEYKYFKQVLKWAKSYNMNKVLSVKKLKPGNQYFPAQFSSAVQAAIGANPYIECVYDSKTKVVYLEEIRICFDKTLVLIDCDGIKRTPDTQSSTVLTNCPAGKQILYPKTASVDSPAPKESSGYLMNLYNSINLLKWLSL